MTAQIVSLGTRAAFLAASCSLAFAPAASQAQRYAQVIGNDMSACQSGGGPSVKLTIDGIRSGKGNLFVRTYLAQPSDWLKSKRYLTRLDTRPRAGSMTVCVPLPSAGSYAIVVQHDENGNRETDFNSDGAGMSNNPKIGSFLGIPRPPSVDKARFSAGSGVTVLRVNVRYRD